MGRDWLIQARRTSECIPFEQAIKMHLLACRACIRGHFLTGQC